MKEADDVAMPFPVGRDYVSAGGYDDDMQRTYLKALDFNVNIGPGRRFRNVCRACPNRQPWNPHKGEPNLCPIA